MLERVYDNTTVKEIDDATKIYKNILNNNSNASEREFINKKLNQFNYAKNKLVTGGKTLLTQLMNDPNKKTDINIHNRLVQMAKYAQDGYKGVSKIKLQELGSEISPEDNLEESFAMKILQGTTGIEYMTVVKSTIAISAFSLLMQSGVTGALASGLSALFAFNPLIGTCALVLGSATLIKYARKLFAPEIKKYLAANSVRSKYNEASLEDSPISKKEIDDWARKKEKKVPPTSSTSPKGPTSGDGTPKGPTGGDGTPKGPTGGDGTPKGPTGGDGTPKGPTGGDGTPKGPTGGDGTPKGPTDTDATDKKETDKIVDEPVERIDKNDLTDLSGKKLAAKIEGLEKQLAKIRKQIEKLKGKVQQTSKELEEANKILKNNENDAKLNGKYTDKVAAKTAEIDKLNKQIEKLGEKETEILNTLREYEKALGEKVNQLTEEANNALNDYKPEDKDKGKGKGSTKELDILDNAKNLMVGFWNKVNSLITPKPKTGNEKDNETPAEDKTTKEMEEFNKELENLPELTPEELTKLQAEKIKRQNETKEKLDTYSKIQKELNYEDLEKEYAPLYAKFKSGFSIQDDGKAVITGMSKQELDRMHELRSELNGKLLGLKKKLENENARGTLEYEILTQYSISNDVYRHFNLGKEETSESYRKISYECGRLEQMLNPDKEKNDARSIEEQKKSLEKEIKYFEEELAFYIKCAKDDKKYSIRHNEDWSKVIERDKMKIRGYKALLASAQKEYEELKTKEANKNKAVEDNKDKDTDKKVVEEVNENDGKVKTDENGAEASAEEKTIADLYREAKKQNEDPKGAPAHDQKEVFDTFKTAYQKAIREFSRGMIQRGPRAGTTANIFKAAKDEALEKLPKNAPNRALCEELFNKLEELINQMEDAVKNADKGKKKEAVEKQLKQAGFEQEDIEELSRTPGQKQ